MYNVTVIMPVYNQSTYVRCAVSSILRQSLASWQLIMVDDGSTDNLYDAVSGFLSDGRISYVRNEENKGLGYSLNRAMDMADAEYIAYLPADDIYFRDHLQTMYDKIVSESADMVYSGIVHNIGNHGGEHGTQQCRGLEIDKVILMRFYNNVVRHTTSSDIK